MSKAYEEMSDEELNELLEQALREHEAGIARFEPLGERALRTIGTAPLDMRVPTTVMERIEARAAALGLSTDRLVNRWLEEAVERESQGASPCVATLRLTKEQVAQLVESGHLDIRIEAGWPLR